MINWLKNLYINTANAVINAVEHMQAAIAQYKTGTSNVQLAMIPGEPLDSFAKDVENLKSYLKSAGLLFIYLKVTA